MRSLSVGLIGCGRVAAAAHLPVLMALPGVRVVALAEPDPTRRAAASARVPGARALSDQRALLELDEVEAVIICLPNALHAETTVAAAERGKHVYLEKPLALTLDDGVRILEARERAGIVGMIGFNQRFNPLYRDLRRAVRTAELGPWVGARTILAAPESTLPDWKRSRRSGGGALLDQASHHIDLVRFVFDDEITEVSAIVRSGRSEDDTAIVSLRLAGGLLVQSFLTIHALDEDRIEVFAEGGRLSADRWRSNRLKVLRSGSAAGLIARLGAWKGIARWRERRRAPAGEPSFRRALERFVESVRAGESAEPSFEDGYESLRLVMAAEESARTGRVVHTDSSGRGVLAR